MKILYLMRHGETVFNVRKKKQGWCDSPLTEDGIYQAKVASEYFKKMNISFDHVFSSTSERACDTCELVASLPYMRTKGLKEWNFGLFEGESEELNPPLPYGDFFATYGGEGEEEFRNRTVKACKEIMEQCEGVVLAVSHGAFCAQSRLDYLLKNNSEHRNRIGNCCIFKYKYENGEFTLLGEISHEEQIKTIQTN